MTVTSQPVSYTEDTVWKEPVQLIDRVPRWLAMAIVFVLIIGIWDLATRLGWVSAIIMPTPKETLEDIIFVGGNLLAGGSYVGGPLDNNKNSTLGFHYSDCHWIFTRSFGRRNQIW